MSNERDLYVKELICIKDGNKELKIKVSSSSKLFEKFKISIKRLDEKFASQRSSLNKEN